MIAPVAWRSRVLQRAANVFGVGTCFAPTRVKEDALRGTYGANWGVSSSWILSQVHWSLPAHHSTPRSLSQFSNQSGNPRDSFCRTMKNSSQLTLRNCAPATEKECCRSSKDGDWNRDF